METFFGVSAATVLLVLLAGVGLLLGWFAWLGWRARILLRLGARNIPRRPARAGLICFGLMLSTTVIASAFGTGDAMTWTVRSVVNESLGSVDEVVVVNPPRLDRQDRLRALTEPGVGSLAATGLEFFLEEDARRIASSVDTDGEISAIIPAIAEQATVIDPAAQQLQSAMLVLATPPDTGGANGLETSDGRPVSLATLGPDEVLLNQAAAGVFGAGAGTMLQVVPAFGNPEVIGHDGTWEVRVAAVVKNSGFAGSQAALLLPLARWQAVVARGDQVNAALVVNRGGVAAVTYTDQATQELRVLLVNRPVAERLHEILSEDAIQRGMLEAEGSLDGDARERLVALREESARPEVTDRFISLISDPRVRGGLYSLARNQLRGEERQAAFRLLRNVSTLSVLPIKQQGIEQADEYGSVVTTVFLVLGIFSIAASVLLIFLIFSLLAADRGAELATMRALGMRDRQVMGMFLVEGLLYDIVGAAAGALAGLGASWLTISSLSATLAGFGFHVRRHVEPRSLAIAFAIGLLLTFAAMLLSAWRVSRAQIVAATRGETLDERRGWLAVVGVLLLAGAGYLWWRERIADPPPRPYYLPRPSLILPAGLTLLVLGLAALLLPRAARARRAAEVLGVAAGLALIVIWLRALAALPTPRGLLRDDALTVAVAGLALLLAGIWTTTRLLSPLLRLLDRALSGVGRLRAIVRPAAGYLGWQLWRTGLAAVMFGMVVFIMAAALTMIHVLLNAYDRDTSPVAGFQIRVDAGSDSAGTSLDDILADSSAVSRDAFSAVGAVSTLDASFVQLGVDRAAWHDTTLAVADDALLGTIEAPMSRQSTGVDDPWRTLRDQPGTAVVSASLLNGVLAADGHPEDRVMQPITIWLRPVDESGGERPPVRLRVVGAIDPRTSLSAAIYTSAETAAAFDVPLPIDAYYLAVASGVALDDAMTGLEITFSSQPEAAGWSATDLGDALRISRSVRTLLTRLVQGFMGLGLIAGIAALGMLGVQSVIERRQQLGTLRALGFTRWETRSTLAIESIVTAGLGIGVGLALGLLLARSLVALLGHDHPEVLFVVPWGQIAFTAMVAWLGSLLAIAVAVWQAGRVSPADALRTV